MTRRRPGAAISSRTYLAPGRAYQNQDRDNLETLLHALFPPHSFRIYLDDAKDGHHIPPGTTTPQRASPEPIALYRIEERAGVISTSRGGDVVALGLYVHAGVDTIGEEKIVAEATRAKTQQGRAAFGAPRKFIGLWGGQWRLGIMGMEMGERWSGERVRRVNEGVWEEHFGRLGSLEGEGVEVVRISRNM
ncbi:MAG: hypothetical protein ASARMPREDX12_004072 [Alectoria sarmentosa]|nr:MAG: hypothetical protein ASARMPREDX12_004072 [Alectoria sarmentosa]